MVTTLNKSTQTVSYQLARNSLYNLVTQIAMMALGVWAIPKIVHGLADERFGLLSLIWAFLGYFSLLDLGVSRAATKFLVDAITRNIADEIRAIISTSVQLTLLIGLVVSVALWLLTPWIVGTVFSVSPELQHEARAAMYWTACALPLVLLSGIARAGQMAYQRFDVMNILQASLGSTQWIGSVVLVMLGYGLTEIVALSVVVRVLTTIASFWWLRHIVPPEVTFRVGWDRATIRRLFGFGGWVTVSQIVAPLFQYMDRFLIGLLLTLSAVAYYAVPQEILSRLLVIPFSLSLVLFPALSQGEGALGMSETQSALYQRSMRYLLAFVLPISLAGVSLAADFLQWWVGPEFARSSTIVLQVLSVGFLFNALAQIPLTAVQAAGRPDTVAKFHMMEIGPTLVVAALLIYLFGLVGAAVAFTLRVIADCLLLSYAAHRLIPKEAVHRNLSLFQPRSLANSLVFMCLVVVLAVSASGVMKLGLLLLLLGAYSITLWFIVFDETDRRFFLRLREGLFARAANG
jgi:O-antigen/teichoic acid export membrane protein